MARKPNTDHDFHHTVEEPSVRKGRHAPVTALLDEGKKAAHPLGKGAVGFAPEVIIAKLARIGMGLGRQNREWAIFI